MGNIGPVAIDVVFGNPILHRVNHCPAHIRVVKVQICNIGPVGPRWVNDVAVLVLGVPLGVLGDPWVTPAGVVCHPVQDYLHAHALGLFHQVPKVLL